MIFVLAGAKSGDDVHANIAWPELPGGLAAELGLRCERCGYALRMAARSRPTDFEQMVRSFLQQHTHGGCHGVRP